MTEHPPSTAGYFPKVEIEAIARRDPVGAVVERASGTRGFL